MTTDFTEPTTEYWQSVAEALPEAECQAPYRFAYPVRLPDGSWLRLPIRPRRLQPDRAVASFIANHAAFAVLDRLGGQMADQVRALAPEIVVGLPTLGLALATPLARRLGHHRLVPLGTSRKYWYDDRLSEEARSITTEVSRRLYLDPNLVPLVARRRVLIVDDTISSGTTAVAALGVLRKAGAEVVGLAFAMSQGGEWRTLLAAQAPEDAGRVSFTFSTPHLMRDPAGGGWVPVEA